MKTIKTTIVMATALLCKMVTGLIAVKLCAKYVGIENFGLTGQISSLIAIVTLLASGGVAVGLAKVRSDVGIAAAVVAQWISAGRILCVTASALLSVLFLLCHDYIEVVVLGNSIHGVAILGTVLIAIFPIGMSGISQGLINGSQNSGLYARSLMLGSIIGISGFLLLSESWHAKGALLGIIWLPLAQSLAVIFIARRLRPAPSTKSTASNLFLRVDRADVIYLGKFGLLSITAGSTIPLAYIFVRLLVATHVGAENLGLWQATVRLSEAYTQLPMVMLSVIFFGKFASHSKNELNWRDVINAYSFIFALMTIIALFVYCARHYLIQLLFTKEFLGVEKLVSWQLIGDLLRMLSYVGTTILAARGFVKICIFAEILQGALFAISSTLIVPIFGALGPFIAYITTYGIYFVFSFLILIYLQSGSFGKYANFNR
jgi:polysaccharide transporter, PST family